MALMVAQNYRPPSRNLIVIIKAPTLGFAVQAMPPDLTLTRKAVIWLRYPNPICSPEPYGIVGWGYDPYIVKPVEPPKIEATGTLTGDLLSRTSKRCEKFGLVRFLATMSVCVKYGEKKTTARDDRNQNNIWVFWARVVESIVWFRLGS